MFHQQFCTCDTLRIGLFQGVSMSQGVSCLLACAFIIYTVYCPQQYMPITSIILCVHMYHSSYRCKCFTGILYVKLIWNFETVQSQTWLARILTCEPQWHEYINTCVIASVVCNYDKREIIQWLEDMNFIFKWTETIWMSAVHTIHTILWGSDVKSGNTFSPNSAVRKAARVSKHLSILIKRKLHSGLKIVNILFSCGENNILLTRCTRS